MYRPLACATALTLVSGLAGCGGGDDGPIVAEVVVEGFEVSPSAPAAARESVDDEVTMAFDPTEIKVPVGRVQFTFTNAGEIPHTFVIESRGFKLQAFETGASSTNVTRLPEGAYFFYCDIRGHREAGMQGALLVGDVPDAVDQPGRGGVGGR